MYEYFLIINNINKIVKYIFYRRANKFIKKRLYKRGSGRFSYCRRKASSLASKSASASEAGAPPAATGVLPPFAAFAAIV